MAAELNLSAEEQVLFERLKPLYEQELLRMVKAMCSKKDEESFWGRTSMRYGTGCMSWERRLWRLPSMSGKKRGGYVGASCVCAHCGGDAKFVAHRDKGLVSLLGEFELRRSYYHCRKCGRGQFPWERMLRLTHQRLTPAAEEIVSLLGVQSSFAEVAERTLRKACGLRVSESTVERTTEAAGERLIEQQQARVKFGPDEPWDWERDAQGRTCACASLDATGIRQQGEHGAAADGRMAYVGMISNPRGAARPPGRETPSL